MSYFVILLAFALATAAAAVGTSVMWLYRPLRPMFPFVWRVWFWGTLGFLITNALFIASLFLLAPHTQTASSNSWLQQSVQLMEFGVLLVGPFAASAIGTLFGVFLGCFLGWRVVDARARAASAT